MTCPHLEYRAAEFADTDRAYCTVIDEFVEPMRADICNDRYELSHAEDCEFYREVEGLDDAAGADDDPNEEGE